MNEQFIKNLRSKSGIMLIIFALAVFYGLGAMAYGQTEKKTEETELSQISLLDPFTLTVIPISNNGPEGSIKVKSITELLSERTYFTPQIKIPYRPALRSPYRPPM